MDGELYRALYRIRRVEEEVARIYPTDKIKSPVHLSIGQEAVSVGVCAALRASDVVFGTYRGHALYLAKGGDLRRMMAELYGKATGCTGGKGGSMHLIDVRAGVMGAGALVGSTIPHAVGFAYAARVKRRDQVVVSFFGDGAFDEGVFHESLNFAALKRLPVLFVCENNGYSIHSPQAARQRETDLARRARSYGIEAERLQTSDAVVVRDQARAFVDRLRTAGQGPFFLECITYRWREHVGPDEDFAAGYRGRAEAQPWLDSDPVRLAGERLGADLRARLEREVDQEIRQAVAFAEDSPFPPADHLLSDLFAGVADA